jgi:hypothetical protein
MKMKRKSWNSRSQAHVEMMISFVIFLGALILIFLFLSPFAKTKTVDNSINEVQKIILNKISSDIGKLSVIVNSSSDCYDVPAEYGTGFIEAPDANPRRYNLYFNLNGAGLKSCLTSTGRNFSLGVYSTENLVVYDNAVGLTNNYNSDYKELKNSLGITKDFSFSFRELDGSAINQISVLKNISQGIEVSSNDIPVRVINSSAAIKNLILNIRVW